MSFFVRRVSLFIVFLFLLNTLFFSFHFASVKHHWNQAFNRFEHCHDDEDDFSLLFDGAAFSFIKESLFRNPDSQVFLTGGWCDLFDSLSNEFPDLVIDKNLTLSGAYFYLEKFIQPTE